MKKSYSNLLKTEFKYKGHTFKTFTVKDMLAIQAPTVRRKWLIFREEVPPTVEEQTQRILAIAKKKGLDESIAAQDATVILAKMTGAQ